MTALLSARDLAAAIGRSPCWVTQARKAGLPFFCGRTTVADAIAWMRANPDFKAIDYRSTPAGTRKADGRKDVA